MAIIWPGTLSQYPLKTGFVISPQKQTIRSEMDIGPAKQRRRTSANTVRYTCKLMLTDTEKATFDTFYNDTTQGGSLAFTWDYFSNDVRFVGQPSFSPIRPDLYQVTFYIEELP